MKNLIIVLCLLISLPALAQTKVTKKVATKSNNFGITYSLPKTTLIVNAEVTKVTCKAGPYYRYAEKYLGVKNPVAEDKVYYQLGKITLINKGIPDPENTYIVEFKSGTVAPYAFLTEEGLLCSINADYTPPASELETVRKDKTGSAKVEDISVFSEELLMAGSTAKQAEVAAKQIYRIRESRMNILTGEADNLPPDGEAMKLVIEQLENQEKALTNLFTGICSKETDYYDVTVEPNDNMEKDVLFRFSELLGIVPADDLGGTPVYMNLKAIERAPVLDAKEAEKKEKSLKGIIYNVPGKASVEIVMNKNALFRGEVQIVQFGSREGLAPVMFEDKKAPVKVLFYPETGAIKQIIQ
ncbi:hypothetical protein M2459_001436 [Parabacteroides sp. PF5-5]|uniref:DUF4831 family protein n=1 Tax=unclassified Parabacteroides TaxID=2649774 RepID=UPI0024742998|nr:MULTISPECIES: DUF4831 family protein [unclassified Parabacteroides]MDH6304699.1 hypothetical protein [Parabacteroides sp. PH5-39]MDH6315686.1 hypothetical protein [Parabacteroides sp. PF5-13]MDH6319347.1 hypothetical protein [Parabacteroides sp. PH5-13]MDH6323078.1 hypothetical protein [Parabacteroides sp. PH5-8]MDH6326879.1 hypothetical protein [Parabacteroides sp. PH5-41]